MARRILNRKEMRDQYDAAERRQQDEGEEGDEREEDEDEDEEKEKDASDDEGGDDDDEAEVEAPPKAKKKPAAKTTKAKPRSRSAKVVRMKVVWQVLNNSNQLVATYDYPKRREAEEHAARLTADKKSTHFIRPEKVQMEEKKE